MDLLSPILLVLLSFHGAKSTFSPSDSVSIDCGGQQTFTCTLAASGPASWTITGLQGIAATGSNGVVAGINNARITSAETVAGLTSTITITGFTTADNGGTIRCDDQVPAVEGSSTVVVGPPQCGQVGVIYGNDACPSFTFTRQGNFLPSTVMVSYQQLVGGSSSAGSMNCSYPVDPQMCRLVVPGGTYSFTLTPLNSCGSPSSTCPLITETIPDDCRQSPPPTAPTPTVSIGLIAGVSVGGVVGVIVVGVSGYGITILIMGFTCYSSLGFLALLKCLCCPCSEGKARKSSSKQRIDSASPVTPPAQPPAQPPSDEYADPQAIRDRKERGKEDKDKIQYAAIDFSAGAGSGAGEVKIHQKEEPVIYTTVQHV